MRRRALDPRSPAGLAPPSDVDRLAEAVGVDFPCIRAARRRTLDGLARKAVDLGVVVHDPDAAIVLMGSWGRHEVTAGSDDDFTVLVDAPHREAARPRLDVVRQHLSAAGEQGTFGELVFSDDLLDKIGLGDDTNANHTRRMLLLLESVPATGATVHRRVRERIVATYLQSVDRDYRPPRFLLNDLVRYWRTIAVDFEGKARAAEAVPPDDPDEPLPGLEPEPAERAAKWGLRSAKLRTSRTILFAGGLLPVLECGLRPAGEVEAFLLDSFDRPPTDRIARAFLDHDAPETGERVLTAYDRVLALLDDLAVRAELEAVTRDERNASPAYRELRELGVRIRSGLLALLFERPRLRGLVREYGLF